MLFRSTPEMLKQLGMALHMPPAKIEHVVRGYTGGLGIGLMSLLNPLLVSPLDEHGPVAKRVSELPFIGTLFQPNDASGVVNDAYESVKEIQKKQATYRKLEDEGRMKEAEQYVKDNLAALQMESEAGYFQKVMGDYAKAEREVRALPASEMGPDEKREKIAEIKQAKIELANQLKESHAERKRQTAH